jgi:serine/threonine protein kinase
MNRDEIFRETDDRDPLALPSEVVLHDQFRIGRVLGAGGFGITYLAYDKVLEMIVAVKEYFPQHLAVDRQGRSTVSVRTTAHNEDFRFGLDRFLSEARMLAKFEDHPNIVRVRTFFEENSTGYLVMNYYEGQTLGEYLQARHGRLDEAEALHIMHNVLDGLAAVHGEGILHRDIDPSNIYLADKGRVVLLDFGAARNAIGERTQTLSVMLKRGYAPHEQYHSRGAQGPWTDVYACASTLYRTLTGYKTPEAPARIMNDELVPPKHIVPSLSDTVNDAILEGLTMRPVDRPQSIEAFQDLLPPRPESDVARWMYDADPGAAGSAMPNGTGASEVVVTAVYPCELYVDGQRMGAIHSEGETLTLHLESGRHRIRGVRTDLVPDDGSATVTSSPSDGDDLDRSHIPFDALIWNTEIVASPSSTTSVELTFDPKSSASLPQNGHDEDDTATVTGEETDDPAAEAAEEPNAAEEPDAAGPHDATRRAPREGPAAEDLSPEETSAKGTAPAGTSSKGTSSQGTSSKGTSSLGTSSQGTSETTSSKATSESAGDIFDVSFGSETSEEAKTAEETADDTAAPASSIPSAGEAIPVDASSLPEGLTPARLGGVVVALLVLVGGLGWFLLRNQVPVPSPDRTITDRSSVVVNVTANDRDPDRDAPGVGLRVAGVASLPNDVGQASVVDSARIRFEPAPGFAGVASIAYSIVDADEGRAEGVAEVMVPFAAAPDTVATGIRDPQVLAVGDLTGSGSPEMLTAAYAGASVTAYRYRPGAGSAAFGPPFVLDAQARGAIDVAVADFDGDGDQDVAAAVFREDVVRWYENQSRDSLAFAAPRALSAELPGAYSVQPADMNGDGAVDLVAASRLDGRIVWFPNRGADASPDSLFGMPQPIADGLNGLESIAVGDLDGNGRPDVASATYNDDTVAWHAHQKDGTFRTLPVDTAAVGALSIHIADLNGDGVPDLLAGTAGDDRVMAYVQTEGDGAGPFGPPTLVTDMASDPEAVRSGDVDGDGDLDVLTASFGNGVVAWHLNDGNENFSRTLLLTDRAAEVLDARPFDLDDDGDLDVAFVSQADDAIAWFKNATQ